MTDTEFVAALERLELKQVDLVALLRDLSGVPVAPTTVNRYATGKAEVPAGVAALLRVLEHEVPRKRLAVLVKDARQ